MQPIVSTKKSAHSIGEPISQEYFQDLTDGFARMHPTEEKSVFISRETILEALATSPVVCGIRFMYGQQSDADVCSRVVLLMPCYEKTTGNLVPNLFVHDDGYLTQDGERVTLDACFEMFDRHVDRMAALLPSEARKDLPRGEYFGADTLRDLLDHAGCAGIRFHFGYNPANGYLAERYQSVLQAVTVGGWGIGDPIEDGQRCPTACDGLPGGLLFQADVLSGADRQGSSTPEQAGQAARTIGSYISHDYFQSLIDGFELMHPTEEKSVDIPKELIEAVLNESAEVCGIRFMYGQQAGADRRSRVVLLMACYEKNTGNLVPHLMVGLAGHPLHTGERVSLDACFDLFERHVDRMAALLPEAARKDLPRGEFFGIDILRDLLDQPGCAAIRFHFGYNPANGYLAERYESVLQAMNVEGWGIGDPVEQGQRCPPGCNGLPGGGGMLLKAAVNVDLVIGGARSGALYEMYHHLSPAIVDAIVKEGGDHKTVYAKAFAESFTLLSEGKPDEAAASCRQSLNELVRKYLTRVTMG